MSVLRIEADSTPYYDMEVVLDGVEFILEFMLNSRDGSWYLSVYDASRTILRAGVRLVINWPLMRSWVSENSPSGDIVCITQGQNKTLPGEGQLGVDAVLTYIEGLEVV